MFTKAQTTLSVFSASAVSLYDDMNTGISESHFISILPFNFEKKLLSTVIKIIQLMFVRLTR